MSDIVLSAGLFTGEPIEEFIVLNADEVEATKDSDSPVKPQGAYFMLKPVSPEVDIEYNKLRGQDVKKIAVTPEQGEGGMRMKFGEMVSEISNERELKAKKYLARNTIFGWRGIKLSDGSELKFCEKNLEILACLPKFKPVLDRPYELALALGTAEEGN